MYNVLLLLFIFASINMLLNMSYYSVLHKNKKSVTENTQCETCQSHMLSQRPILVFVINTVWEILKIWHVVDFIIFKKIDVYRIFKSKNFYLRVYNIVSCITFSPYKMEGDQLLGILRSWQRLILKIF